MNPYDQLEHETRGWSVCEVAAFLGYSPNYIYQLIHENKIEGWIESNGSYRFCPAKLKAWMEKKFNKHENSKPVQDNTNNHHPTEEDKGAA